MATLKPLSAVLGDGHRLTLVEGGPEYLIPYVSAQVGLDFGRLYTKMAKAMEAAQRGEEVDPSILEGEALSDREEVDLYRDALTAEVYDQMVADGAPFVAIRMAALYVLIHDTQNADAAADFWATGGKGQARNRATRRTATRTRTAAGNTTRKRA